MLQSLRPLCAAFLIAFGSTGPIRAASLSADQISKATSASVSASLSTPYSAVINGSSTGMTCDGDTTVGSDGATVDTDGLKNAVAAAAALPEGAEIVLPTGACEFNQEIDIPVSASVRFTGAGIGLTRLEFFTPNRVTTPVGNGLVFSLTNDANLTIDDFTINRRLGSNLGTTFIGTAITITAGATAPQAGTVTTTNLDIYPAFASAQTDSWNTGLLETNITSPLISNLTVSLPGWAHLPDPGGYQCTANGGSPGPCAIHALPSPNNPVSTPPDLGFGTATGIALQGSGAGNYSVDSVVDALTVSGGLVGLDLRQFQGAYVVDSKFAATVYGIRADSPGDTSELLSVTNSLFNSAVSGIYTNGIGGMQLTGNYIQPSDTDVANLPDWSAVWARNDNNLTVSSNNIIGGGASAAPEYGIWLSSELPNGFPATVTANTIYNLSTPGSICLGNDAGMQSITATGNSLYNCATFLSDLQGGNGYGDNNFETPDMYDDGKNNVTFPNNLTVGTFHSPGSISINDNGSTTFSIASNGTESTDGNLFVFGTAVIAGPVLTNSVLSNGPIVLSGNSAHNGATEIAGSFYFPTTGNPSTITLSSPTGSFPSFTSGLATMFGELTCLSNNGHVISWHVDGHYGISGTTLIAAGFRAAVEGDPDSQATVAALTGTNTVTPIANPNAIGLQVSFGTGVINVWDCTAMLSEMVAN